MHTIESIKPLLISSDYGDNKSLGQPLGLKTIGIVKVKTINGEYGFGESYVAIYVPELFENLVNYIGKYLINKSFIDPREIYQSYFIPFCSTNGLLASVYSAIDIALWEITCKSSKLSLNDFLKLEKNNNLNFYFSGGSAAYNPDEISQEIEGINTKIFKGYKMRIGKANWEYDLKRIESARNKWNQYLMIDSIMGTIRPAFKSNEWANKLNFLEKFNPLWLEEPLDPEDINGLKKLKNYNSKISIALGESLTGKLSIRAYLSNKNLDYLQLDVTNCGGISMLISMISELEKSNKKITMHVWGSPLAFSANLKFASILKNVEWVEYPGVKLHCFTKFDIEYYSKSPNFEKYLSDYSFTNIDFSKVKDQSPFVKGTGFIMPK